MIGWHVARTEPARGLLAERSLVDEGFSVFYPKVREERRWTRGRVMESVRALVPGYVFARFDVETEGWQRINDVPGVRELVYSDFEVPVTIPDAQMFPLLGVCNDGWESAFEEYVEVSDIGPIKRRRLLGGYVPSTKAKAFVFAVGQSVKVIEGPFAGFPGRVARATAREVRAMVVVFGRETPVEGKPAMFEPVTA